MPSRRGNRVKNQGSIICMAARKPTVELLEQHALGQGCTCAPQVHGCCFMPQQMPVLFVSKEVFEVRRMEGTFSAFQRMGVRMVMDEEVKAAFSQLCLNCARHYMQITREQAQQTVLCKGVIPEKNAWRGMESQDTWRPPKADGKKPLMCNLVVQGTRCSEGNDKPLLSLSDMTTAKSIKTFKSQ